MGVQVGAAFVLCVCFVLPGALLTATSCCWLPALVDEGSMPQYRMPACPCSLQLKQQRSKHGYGVQESLEELGRLADTAGLEVVGSTYQLLDDVSWIASCSLSGQWVHAPGAHRVFWDPASALGVPTDSPGAATCRSTRAPTLAAARFRRSCRLWPTRGPPL